MNRIGLLIFGTFWLLMGGAYIFFIDRPDSVVRGLICIGVSVVYQCTSAIMTKLYKMQPEEDEPRIY